MDSRRIYQPKVMLLVLLLAGLVNTVQASAVWTGSSYLPVTVASISQRFPGARHSRAKTRYKRIYHHIRAGDSITSIARQYRISRKQLIRNNNLRRPYRLALGRPLYIKRVRVRGRSYSRRKNRSRRSRVHSSRTRSRNRSRNSRKRTPRQKRVRIVVRRRRSEPIRKQKRKQVRIVIRQQRSGQRRRGHRSQRKRTKRRKVVKTIRVRTYRHRVRRGETVRTIARGYGVSVRQIARLNHLRRPYRVRRGQRIVIKRVKLVTIRKIPVTAASNKQHSQRRSAVQRGRSQTKKAGMPPVNRKKMTNRIAKGKKSKAAKPVRHKPLPPIRVRTYTHRVTRGDNLRRLAKRYHVSQGQLIRLNHLRHPYRLRPGRRLVIKRVMVTRNFDEFGLGDKSKWKEIKPQAPETMRLAGTEKKSHNNNVKIKKPATLQGNSANNQLDKRQTAHNSSASRHASNRHSASRDTSHRRVIKVEPGKSGFMRSNGRWIWPAKGKLDSRFSRSSKGIMIAGQLGQSIFAAAKGKIVYIGDSLIRYGNLIIIKHNNTFFTAYAHNRRLLVQEGDYVQRGQKIAEMGSASNGKVVLHFEIRKDGRPVDPLRYLPEK